MITFKAPILTPSNSIQLKSQKRKLQLGPTNPTSGLSSSQSFCKHYADNISNKFFENLKNTQNGGFQLETWMLKSHQEKKDDFRLPQIRSKIEEKQSEEKKEDLVVEQGQEFKKIRENPCLRKYMQNNSRQKDRENGNCTFLNIIAVKPSNKIFMRTPNSSAHKIELPERRKSLGKEKFQKTNQLTEIGPEVKPKIYSNSIDSKQNSLSLTKFKKRSEQELHRKEKKLLTIVSKIKVKSPPNYQDFCSFISLLNQIMFQKQCSGMYRAFVGKGNNSILVKNTLKSRSWWTICQNESQAQIYWTQSRSPSYLQNLPQGKFERLQNGKKQENMKKLRMELIGQGGYSTLGEKVKDYVHLGFEKLLNQEQRKQFCKSPLNLQMRWFPTYNRILEIPNKLKLHNHVEGNWNLTNKKTLYRNLKSYYQSIGKNPFQYIPQTYLVEGQEGEWENLSKSAEQSKLWIVKPGQNSNRGCGIEIADSIEGIRQIVRKNKESAKKKSHVVQRYLYPFLYNKRKFDMRCYILVTGVNQKLKGYWYEQGYIRTASKQFSLKNIKNKTIHLTNDAVQKYSESYGKFQNANKLSFADFEKYLAAVYPQNTPNFIQNVYPRMIQLAADSLKATQTSLDPNCREFSFEIFGLDFMIDENFKTWLIEVNTNPCLELVCPLLARIIPNMLENAFRIAVDPLFPPPKDSPKSRGIPVDPFQSNKFTLIFQSTSQNIVANSLKVVEQEQRGDEYSDEEVECQE